MDVKEQHILGKHIINHWYYISKGRALCQILSGIRTEKILDVGAGSGVFGNICFIAQLANKCVAVD